MRQNYSFSKNGNALLEPCEGKLSCTVLRGESPSNGADLLDKNPILAKIYDNDMRQQLRQAVDELPDKRREIFRMRFFENMSNKEIGERLGLTVSTVENHMYLALKNLRDKLL